MKSDTMMNDTDFLREYLLGGLPENEVDAMEQRLLEDDELFKLAEALESDLLAACARGELSPEERQRVLRRLAASPRGQAKLALVQGLTTLAAQEKKKLGGTIVPFRPRPALPVRWSTRVAAIAASLAVAVGVSWLAQQTAAPRDVVIADRDTPVPVESSRPAPQAPSTPTVQPEAPTAPEEGTQIAEATPAPVPTPAPEQPERTPETTVPSVVSAVVAITYGTRAGGASEVPEILVPQGTRTVEIQLPLPEGEEAISFQAELLDATTDEEILTWERIEARDLGEGKAALFVEIPAAELPPGKYAINVRGLTPDGESDLLGKPVFVVARP
ncbi:MAG TPA: hypothetical protein VF756_19820 [Thermoanaerobaculia bacterium]